MIIENLLYRIRPKEESMIRSVKFTDVIYAEEMKMNTIVGVGLWVGVCLDKIDF